MLIQFLTCSFHAHTLTLYAALCYQANYRAAHVLCNHVDQKQLLYAIRSEYLSGPLRQGFYDLLIALHIESHATTMLVFYSKFCKVTPFIVRSTCILSIPNTANLF